MTFFLAIVILTIQLFVACLLAGVVQRLVILLSTGYDLRFTCTVAHMFDFFVAFGACTHMTFLRAAMDRAFQGFLTLFIAFQIVFLATLHCL